jgi:hypothetical protein
MARIRMLQYELFIFIEMNAFKVEGHAVCPSLRDRKLPRFGSGSELHTGGGCRASQCLHTSPCKLPPVNPRPALTPSPRNRVGIGARAAPQHAAPQPHNRLSTRVALHHPHLSPNHAAAAANVKFTERCRKARERAAAHCSTCMR